MKTRGLTFIFFLMLLLTSPLCLLQAQSVEQLIEKGNAAYKSSAFTEAQQWYKKAMEKDATHEFPEIQFNLGNALFQQKQFTEALQQFNELAVSRVSTSLKAAAWYNAGNTYLEQKNYTAAAAAYKNTLRLNPRDEDARYNLTLTNTVLASQQGASTKPAARKEKEEFQPPPPENLTPEELKRLLDELNAAENKTMQQRPKKLQQKKKSERDW